MKRADNQELFARRKAQEILRLLHVCDGVLEVHLVSNVRMEHIRALLRALPQFRGKEAEKIKKEKCVSVLAFREPDFFPHPESRRHITGEVYINIKFLHGSQETLLRLLIHGILHIMGYRHFIKRDSIKMERKEKWLFKQVV